jgi:hypothetical protein
MNATAERATTDVTELSYPMKRLRPPFFDVWARGGAVCAVFTGFTPSRAMRAIEKFRPNEPTVAFAVKAAELRKEADALAEIVAQKRLVADLWDKLTEMLFEPVDE